jgi:hypothetical protein
MFFNSRSLLKLAFTTAFALEASALDLQPWGTGHHPGAGTGAVRRAPAPLELKPIHSPEDMHTKVATRNSLPPIELKAISDPGVLLRGRSEKREMPGNGCFDPAKHSTFFWGGYGMNTQLKIDNDTDYPKPATTSSLPTLQWQPRLKMSTFSRLRTLQSA